MRAVWITLAAVALFGASAAAQQGAREARGPLARYATCKFADSLYADSTTRLPGTGVRFRPVTTPKGEKRISAVDGYRVLLSQGRPSYFAELRIEISDPIQYAADRDAAIDNVRYALQSSVGKPLWEHETRDGFDIYGESDVSTGERGPTGLYVLLPESSQTIITVNFLGQAPQDRRFVNIDEHDDIRDGVIDALIKCGRN
jgi:hypothetical protein